MDRRLPVYRRSLAGTLLAAREAVMGPIRPLLRRANVTEQQWRVLRVLDDEGGMEPTALAAAALLYPPSVARILRDLVDRGLVLREPHGSDRRRVVLSLSAGGRGLVRETAGFTMSRLDAYALAFGAERLDALLAELRAFTAAIAADAPVAAPPAAASDGET